MNESMLNALMRLFAIMVSINRGAMHLLARNFVETYLTQQFMILLSLVTSDESDNCSTFIGDRLLIVSDDPVLRNGRAHILSLFLRFRLLKSGVEYFRNLKRKESSGA